MRLRKAIEDYKDYIMKETLSKILEEGKIPKDCFTKEYIINGEIIRIGIRKANNE